MIDKADIIYDLTVAKEYLDNLIEVVERDGFVATSYLTEKLNKVIVHLMFVKRLQINSDFEEEQ